MVSSTELENLLNEYSCCIDKEHVNFFQEMITELRDSNNSTPFMYSMYGLHRYNCPIWTDESIPNVTTCACRIFLNRYKLAEKLFKLYKRIFNSTDFPHLTYN